VTEVTFSSSAGSGVYDPGREMGPVDPLKTNAGKVFASIYALYGGLALIAVVGLLLAPIIHRFLHTFHIADR
jgi:hypothetical protein